MRCIPLDWTLAVGLMLLACSAPAAHYEDHLRRAESLAKSDAAGSLAALDAAIARAPARHEAYGLKAIVLATSGKLAEAREVVVSGLAKAPAKARFDLYRILRTVAPDEAKVRFESTKDAATAADRDGLLFDAAGKYREAFWLDPTQGALGLRAAAAYVGIDENEAALKLITQIELHGDEATQAKAAKLRITLAPMIARLFNASFEAAEKAHKTGKSELAREKVQEALGLVPTQGKGHFLHARIQARAGATAAALAAAKLAIRTGFRDRAAWTNERDLRSLAQDDAFRRLLRGVWGKKVLEELDAAKAAAKIAASSRAAAAKAREGLVRRKNQVIAFAKKHSLTLPADHKKGDALVNKGDASSKKGRYETAKKHFERASWTYRKIYEGLQAAEKNALTKHLSAANRNPLGLRFVKTPKGSFQMGSTSGGDEEKTMHRVTFAKGFLMADSEVTQAQYQAVHGSNPSSFKGSSRPVETVNWHEAVAFTEELTRRGHREGWLASGLVVRLPSEAEWEYACRAGTTGERYGSPDSIAWYSENSGYETHPVRRKQANAWGLYDMLGNVSEWCQESSSDGSVWRLDGELLRVVRGGSWNSSDGYTRSASWSSSDPDARLDFNGFRVVIGSMTR